VLCFFGDGATNQGTFHESLNMAALWRLPVVYICENNLYAMSTRVREATAIERLSSRAAAYGMPGETIDGNDVLAVRDAVAEAAERARGGKGPALLECLTYRYLGHSKSDQREYRSREEEKAWLARDPIRRSEERLLASGELSPEGLAAMDREVAAEIEDAVAFAEASPFPEPSTATDAVYAE